MAGTSTQPLYILVMPSLFLISDYRGWLSWCWTLTLSRQRIRLSENIARVLGPKAHSARVHGRGMACWVFCSPLIKNSRKPKQETEQRVSWSLPVGAKKL
jgi:hypothetical protein